MSRSSRRHRKTATFVYCDVLQSNGRLLSWRRVTVLNALSSAADSEFYSLFNNFCSDAIFATISPNYNLSNRDFIKPGINNDEILGKTHDFVYTGFNRLETRRRISVTLHAQ